MPILNLIVCFIAVVVTALPGFAGPVFETQNGFKELFAAPARDENYAKWLQDMREWRTERRREFAAKNLNWSAAYDEKNLTWTRSSYVQPQVMAHDLFLFASGKYTVKKFLRDLEDRYGSIDSLLLWPTYPNMGIDERNQYDFIRDLPGGLPALKALIAEFHRHGIRVLLPFNPWDVGTRDEGAEPEVALARLLATVGADGFNGDTMTAVEEKYFQASEKMTPSRALAIEPEIGFGDNLIALGWNVMSWGYWWGYKKAPGVDVYKWLEPRHMTHVCRRDAHERLDELQYAWFNGAGYESWENLWGAYNKITPRDGERLRRIAIIDRATNEILVGDGWQPHLPVTGDDVFASLFSIAHKSLVTLVNRSARAQVSQIFLADKHKRYFDLWRGEELFALDNSIQYRLEENGFGAVLILENQQRRDLAAVRPLLKVMHQLSQKSLSDFSNEWQALSQKIVPTGPTSRVKDAPAGMVYVSAAKAFKFTVSGVEIEQYDGSDVQYAWEPAAQKNHSQVLRIDAFYIDRSPVTNHEFQNFLTDTHYWPRDDHNFLKDWVGGRPSTGAEDRPVTWVSIEDARAYAAWSGKRLPHEWEWQYAAQGLDERQYPWGMSWEVARTSTMNVGRSRPLPDRNGEHSSGASPFAVQDLIADVWQWTDEYTDQHTRFAILRGGSNYQPQGSKWYFPNAHLLSQHGKYLLMAPSLDRSGTIGFRCVVDAVESEKGLR